MDNPLQIGSIIFPRVDQIDFTGPFEVLSRLPNSIFHVLWKERAPVVDVNGLILTPTATFAEAPALDLLVIPGGSGQEALMEDEEVLSFIRAQAARPRVEIFSVCTGALLCGAAGLLRGRKATTHWTAFDLLEHFGATPVKRRVVSDGNLTTASGVTAGLDGALLVAAKLRGERSAQSIQLSIEYAPEPPFNAGTPEAAPQDVVDAVLQKTCALSDARLVTARRVGAKLKAGPQG